MRFLWQACGRLLAITPKNNNNSPCFEVFVCVCCRAVAVFFQRVEIFEIVAYKTELWSQSRCVMLRLCPTGDQCGLKAAINILSATRGRCVRHGRGKNCLNQLGSGWAMNDDYAVDHRVNLLGCSFSHLFHLSSILSVVYSGSCLFVIHSANCLLVSHSVICLSFILAFV